ncbi:hypothetical protein ODJ79_45210 [Actinoplanes sp. KI2]|uniref:hypothetical protein n=1 Tax=Actinoplanes sp. KI2 TaxID=2983315 RepID=UPI0021D58D0E|nr:hypothetical protein [Actinoplanes sp. KI2]MCU7730959.1 hypothetical protein [Actinoplanes sp. KI2]
MRQRTGRVLGDRDDALTQRTVMVSLLQQTVTHDESELRLHSQRRVDRPVIEHLLDERSDQHVLLALRQYGQRLGSLQHVHTDAMSEFLVPLVADIKLLPAGKGSRRPFGRHRLDRRWKFGGEYDAA